MKKLKLIITLCLILPFCIHAQENIQKIPLEKDFPKHEIGFSWGAFPTSGTGGGVAFGVPGAQNTTTRFPGIMERYPYFSHYAYKEWNGPFIYGEERETEYYSMQHYGCLTFNYQYHFTKKHSIGFTTSWLGRYVSNYTTKPKTNETINAKGWDNIFTLCANYRFTYYSKDAVSLYTGIHLGFGMGFISRKLLFDSEKSVYVTSGLQITGFGIEAGKTHAFITELGFGCQGLLKVGYRYKFNGNEKN